MTPGSGAGARPPGGRDLLATAVELARRGGTAVLATVVWRRGPSSGKLGSRAVIHPDGRVEGFIGGACAEPTVVREARTVLAEGTARLVFLAPPEELEGAVPHGAVCVPISCESEGALQIFLEPILPAPHLVVVGRTPAVEALVGMAGELGWRTVVVDDGGRDDRHPSAERVVSTLDLAQAGITASSMVVVATQGHYDEDALEQALRTDAVYVGLVASRRRAERILAMLRDRGVAQHDLDRVRAPAGLDLGATGHREIAVAILGELVRLRAEGALEPAAAGTPAAAVEEAVDPVCGMTVEVATARYTSEHGGRTFFFCCAGCRTAFGDDPDAYLTVHER